MIYFIVTTSIFNNCSIRMEQYIRGIQKLKNVIFNCGIQDYEIIIVENNGFRTTILDSLGCKIYYTNNNALATSNIGYKELQDILDCIEQYNINDTDFIVKMTGRYILDDDSEFMKVIQNLEHTKYDCVIKYGWYKQPVDYKTNDCITGLIGMRCRFIKQIEKPSENECVEWKWAKVTNIIDDDKIYKVDKLGIHICPCDIRYFLV